MSTTTIVVIIGSLVVVVGMVGFFMYQNSQSQEKALAAQVAALNARAVSEAKKPDDGLSVSDVFGIVKTVYGWFGGGS